MLVSEIIMKKKHKSLLVLLSLLMLAFLFFPARSEAQVNSGSSRVSYSFAEKSSVSDEHLRQLKEGFPKEIAQVPEGFLLGFCLYPRVTGKYSLH